MGSGCARSARMAPWHSQGSSLKRDRSASPRRSGANAVPLRQASSEEAVREPRRRRRRRRTSLSQESVREEAPPRASVEERVARLVERPPVEEASSSAARLIERTPDLLQRAAGRPSISGPTAEVGELVAELYGARARVRVLEDQLAIRGLVVSEITAAVPKAAMAARRPRLGTPPRGPRGAASSSSAAAPQDPR